MKRVLAVAAICAISAQAAFASDMANGNDWVGQCKPGALNYQGCVFLIGGFVEGLVVQETIDNAKPSVCFPAESTAAQGAAIFEKYMEDHPERLHQAFGTLIHRSLANAFPCGQ